jgi:hypothetical protein
MLIGLLVSVGWVQISVFLQAPSVHPIGDYGWEIFKAILMVSAGLSLAILSGIAVKVYVPYWSGKIKDRSPKYKKYDEAERNN